MRQAAARQRQRRQRRLIKSPLSYSHAAMPDPLFLSFSLPLSSVFPGWARYPVFGLMTSPAE